MAQEQIYESSQFIFDTENQSLSEDKLLEIRFEDEEEDELTRKIKAIPILPRIPKIKKSNNGSDEESKKSVLEHRSVLHRKEFFMNTDESLKWPTADVQPYDRHRKRNFDYNADKKLNKDHTNGSFQHKSKDCDSLNTNKRRLSNRNFSKNLTAEEKFDQLKSNKELENSFTKAPNTLPEDVTHSLGSEKTSVEFDCFENSLLNNVPVKPYKTLEERRLERIKNGLLKSTAEPAVQNSNPGPLSETSGSRSNHKINEADSRSSESNTSAINDKRKPNKDLSHGDGLLKCTKEEGCSNSSSDLDSHTEVIDMEIADSPCEAATCGGTFAKSKPSYTRKVTFNCPDLNEPSKASTFASKKQAKKKTPESSKKNNMQERVVAIMKDFLKPYYSKQKITKDGYKEIMREVVPKFSKNKKEEIKKEKIEHYAEKYMKMIVQKKSKA